MNDIVQIFVHVGASETRGTCINDTADIEESTPLITNDLSRRCIK